MVTKQQVAMGRMVCLMTCLERRPLGRTNSCLSLFDEGGLDGWEDVERDVAEVGGGVLVRKWRLLAQGAVREDAPETRRKRRFEVTLSSRSRRRNRGQKEGVGGESSEISCRHAERTPWPRTHQICTVLLTAAVSAQMIHAGSWRCSAPKKSMTVNLVSGQQMTWSETCTCMEAVS